jgi:hypothetical protein
VSTPEEAVMKVLRIPADTDPVQVDPVKVTELDFDKDQLWRYDVVRRVGSKVFIAERYAELDYWMSNSVANKLVSRLARGLAGPPDRKRDAVSDPTKSPGSSEKLRGPVMVAYWDGLLDVVTGLSEHDITDLTVTLKLIDPLISVERLHKSPDVVSGPERLGLEKRDFVPRPERLRPTKPPEPLISIDEPPVRSDRPYKRGPDSGGPYKGLG